MTAVLQSCLTWLQRNLAWSNSRQSWQERFGALLLLAGTVAVVWFGRHLSLSTQAALGCLLLVGFAVLLRRGWVKLFGPVLFYDMLRTGRRSRYVFFRTLYLVGLLLLLTWVYFSWGFSYRYAGRVPATMMAQFAESFFQAFMIVQLVLVLVLTPAYVAGAIADEKDRKTLEFLLATDLRNREIVLSKLVSRLANLSMLVIAGLPVLSALQFLGGVDPELLLASFAMMGLTMASLAGVSILFSSLSRKPRDAIVLTYLTLFLYLILSLVAQTLVMAFRIGGSLPLGWLGINGVSLGDVADAFCMGNPIWLGMQPAMIVSRGGNLGDVLPGLIGKYAIFHGIVTVACSTAAVFWLRAAALNQSGEAAEKGRLLSGLVSRPPVSQQPMMWKEIHAEPRLRLGMLGRIIMGCLVCSSFVPVYFILEDTLGRSRWADTARFMNIWVRIVGTVVGCLMLLAVAVRAAGSVSGERDKETLDGLLTSPLDGSDILFAKWAGSILSVRWAWLWIGTIWLLGLVSGGLHILSLPLLVFSWAVYAAVFSWIGVICSVTCRTTLRATVWTLLTVLFVGGGHWIVMSMCCFAPLACAGVRGGGSEDMRFLLMFEWGQTPPLVLGTFAFCADDFPLREQFAIEGVVFTFIGLGTWILAIVGLSNSAIYRFNEIVGRTGPRAPRFVDSSNSADGAPPANNPAWPPRFPPGTAG